MSEPLRSLSRIAYLGPQGTFSEEALLSEPDLAECEVIPTQTIAEAIAAAANGEVDAAFVPLENAIEGSINATLDQLVFDVDLTIEREVVLEIHLDLLGVPGVTENGVRRVYSFPAATAQCRKYLAEHYPEAEIVATNSTADAARTLAEEGSLESVAVSPTLAAKLYGLEIISHAIEDHPGNQTRFALVGRRAVPRPTGRDRTTIVCFQRANRPGSLAEMLTRFAAREVNLTRIESRPTKQGLGDYCFVIEFEGHLMDEIVGDCLRDLHMITGRMKFLGSYPVPGGTPSDFRARVEAERRLADEWLAARRGSVEQD